MSKFIVFTPNCKLITNWSKLMEGGNIFMSNVVFEEIMQGIKDAGYTFLRPNKDESPLNFRQRIIPKIEKSREAYITEELVRELNLFYKNHGLQFDRNELLHTFDTHDLV